MRIVGGRFLSGPNVHDDSSGVVIGTKLESLPPVGEPFVIDRDRSDRIFGALAIAGLAEDWAATAERGRAALPGFLLRLATALVTPASIFPSGGQIIGPPEPRLAVFIRCEHETTGLRAWDCACKAVMACLAGQDQVPAFEAALASFRNAARRMSADITTAAVAREARQLDIPWYRLKIPGQFVQLGQGVHRRYLFDSTSDATGAISRLMSHDKQLTNRILRAAGVPVLPMAEVTNEAAAIAAAERIGYPVVVKPCHGGQGRGVAVHLTAPAEVAAAFKAATADSDSVIVEKFASGDDHRVLVLDGRVVSVARRVPAHVIGDGRHSVAALVEMLNQDPRRGHDHDTLLVLVEIDAGVVALLAKQGLTPDSVPEPGRRVMLKRTANVSTGGTAVDATDAIHPDNEAMMERAASTMELAIAGVDFLSDDITRSWREVGGVVLEMNAFPGLRPHWLAHPGRSVEAPLIRALFQPGLDGRIPTCAITGSIGKTTTANMVARILGTMGLVVGRCTTTGVSVGAERRQAGDCAGGRFARELLLDRRVEAGVFELARGGLLRHGMTIEDCEVGAVLNVYDNHVGVDGIASRADLARIKSIVARRARRMLVLNGEDPLCLAMRQVARADRVCLVGREARSADLRAHIAAGGLAVTLRPAPATRSC
jgi:cyanophycin synthetase